MPTSDLDVVKNVFRRFDQNGDGVIDGQELKNVLQTLDATTWTDDHVGSLLSLMDTSGDGCIQYEELVNWVGGARPSRDFHGALEHLRGEGLEGEGEEEATDDEEAATAATAVDEKKKKCSGRRPVTTAKPKRKALGGIGMKCEKTLEFGKPIRSAICIGNEVWTVDWQGAVTVRERDDAAKVLGAISTDRFVWSMLHMKPGLMWMGQEAHGIALFDSKKQEFKGTLTGGHTGGVLCLTVDDSLGDDKGEGTFPQRKAWSGSNDFTIREWWIHTWRAKETVPPAVSDDRDAVVVDLGKCRVGISKGRHMHGHKNGVKALLKLGPILWSGSDDGTIRLWRCVDGECVEVVEDAHNGSVNRLAVVKSFVWSAGADGTVKEWTMGGAVRECVRQIAPPGSEKGIYALLPLGHDVLICGHHPAIQVFSQSDMSQTSEEEGHKPYVSNLIGVDRVETKIVWSTSFGDRKLKVWRHTTRGEQPSVDELKGANLLYQQEEEAQAERMCEYVRKLSSLEESSEERQREMDGLSHELDTARSRSAALESELDELRKVFEEAGLAHLMTDPASLKAFVDRSVRLEEALRGLGSEHLLDEPEELVRLLKTMQQFKDILERCGFGGVLEDPSTLEDVLTRYNAMKKSFEEHGFSELFEDVQKLDGFLQAHSRVRAEFRDAGLEHLMDDALAAHEFLEKRAADDRELLHLREQLARLESVETQLREREAELSDRKAELESALHNVETVTCRLEEQTKRSGDLESEVEGLAQQLAEARSRCDTLDEQRSRTEDALTGLQRVFEEAGLGHLMADMTALQTFIERAVQLQDVLRSLELEHLLDDPDELARLLRTVQHLKDILERCGFGTALENPSELEKVLQRYNAMQKAFEEHGFSELFEDTSKLDDFLRGHSQVRAVFRDASLEHLLDDAQAARDFLDKSCADEQELKQLRKVFEEAGLRHLISDLEALKAFVEGAVQLERQLEQSSKELARLTTELDAACLLAEQGQYDRQQMAKLRLVFEEAGQSKLLEEYDAVSTTDGGDDAEEDDFKEEANDEEEEDDEEEKEGEGEEEEDHGDGEGDDMQRDVGEERRSAPAGNANTSPSVVTKSSRAPATSNSGPSFRSLRVYLSRNFAIEKALRDVGMEHLLDDPLELARLLRILKELRSVLAMYGFGDVEKDLSQLAEVLSRYNTMKAAFEEHGFDELFEDPEYSLKAFLRNQKRIRAEFDKHGLGYLFDSVPAMRDFLDKFKDMAAELSTIKEARAGEKLAQRDAEMARLESRLRKKEADLDAVQDRLREYERLGDVEAVLKWKADSEELKRLQRIYNSMQSKLNAMEKTLQEKEKDREDALERERMMSVKYKELDIFKLDIIARELKGLDGQLGLLGTSTKSLQQDAGKLRNYDEQQRIGQHGDTMLDQCKLLRAHIRDVIHKCLSETQKMHIGVAIDDHLAAGELRDGGSMVAVVYEEVERPCHGHSRAAKLRQHDEVHVDRHR